METEFIYETDLSAFAQAAAAGVQVPVSLSEDGTFHHHDPHATTGDELEVETQQVTLTDAEAAEMDAATAAAVAGIPVPTSESLHLGDHNLLSETTVSTADLMSQLGASVDAEVTHLLSADQIPIMTAGSHIIQPDVEISPEDELRSNERLDRSSPDLWPQNLSSAAHQILAKSSLKTTPTPTTHHRPLTSGIGSDNEPNLGSWAQGLDPEDINLLHQFGSLTSSSLVEEVKKLQNIAYQLGLEESKEMTRGKLLHVLDEEEASSKPNHNITQINHSLWQ